MRWLRRLRLSTFPSPTWEEICALRSALRDRERVKRIDGTWRLKESLEETDLLESLLGKLRKRFHLLGE